ncbi:MAG TPA: adenosylmethionine--8-amino-7-oxononanoate transaminase [Candidatus Kapabacteria bacterium]|jgi:adenosylmethionine-8-amino-7-oxononanoate aminotransferase|nr:adenosylmethionine--8-amino-7-oxononanoate transaminase [Candidatus Kapabacteria bacterium]
MLQSISERQYTRDYEWKAWDAGHIWHPYTQMKLMPEAIAVDRAEGSYLYLADGRRLFDGISSWWVTLHGHAHPRIAKAIADQASKLEQVIFAGFTHEPAATLAHRLIQRAPSGLTKAFFSDDGSTAVEVALKMSIQYWKHQGEDRRTFLALEHAYHGDTFGAMSISERGTFTDAFAPFLFDVKRLPFPSSLDGIKDFSEAEDKFLNALRTECKKNTIAAFIYEPLLLGAGGMKTWRPQVLEAALAIAREHNVLTIADEVLTGFGRTGTFFASEQTTIAPDMMTLSKGLTGGFLPMGMTLASQQMFDAFLSDDRSKTFFHGHSYTGNPISCAAALASLDVFEMEPVMDRIRSIERVHRERLPKLAERLGNRYRVLGTVAAMEPQKPTGYLSPQMLAIPPRAIARGMLIRPLGDVIYLLPPYSSTEEDLHRAYDVLTAVIEQ